LVALGMKRREEKRGEERRGEEASIGDVLGFG